MRGSRISVWLQIGTQPPLSAIRAVPLAARATGLDSVMTIDHFQNLFPRTIWDTDLTRMAGKRPTPHEFFDYQVLLGFLASRDWNPPNRSPAWKRPSDHPAVPVGPGTNHLLRQSLPSHECDDGPQTRSGQGARDMDRRTQSSHAEVDRALRRRLVPDHGRHATGVWGQADRQTRGGRRRPDATLNRSRPRSTASWWSAPRNRKRGPCSRRKSSERSD